MNKICPNCRQNFSEEFDECVCCGETLVLQQNMEEIEDLPTDKAIYSMTDQEILDTYKSYKEFLLQQGTITTDEDFVQGIRQNTHDKRMSQMELETVQTKNEKNIPKCPTCQSTNIQKINGLERGVSVAAWGLFSKKINKSFKCKNCGYTW